MMRYVMLTGAWIGGVTMVLEPAHAQYDEGLEDRSRRYDNRRFDDEDRDESRRFRRYGPGVGGSVCITARGNCSAPPGPFGASCGCVIPGFGYKRGAVGG